MSNKNIEIVAQIIEENTIKFQQLLKEQSNLLSEFKATINQASTPEISTERLEEVILHWNTLFIKQKNQLEQLQKTNAKENNNHRKTTYFLLILISIILISIFYTLKTL